LTARNPRAAGIERPESRENRDVIDMAGWHAACC
jgi:hypothetical protein